MIGARLRQFLEASRLPRETEFAFAREHLEPGLYALFCGQHPRDIVHSVATARWLLERGYGDPDLVAAALLHDIGKGQQRRRDRVAWVLLSATGLGSAAADTGSRFEMRRALARTRWHAATGAEALARAGACERVVDLTRRHHDANDGDPVLALLQAADAAT